MPSLGTDDLSSSSTTLLTILFSHSASFRPPTLTCRALQHSLGTARRRSFPPLNLHRARVRRKSRAASFKSLYRKREHTVLVQAHCLSRFRYNTRTCFRYNTRTSGSFRQTHIDEKRVKQDLRTKKWGESYPLAIGFLSTDSLTPAPLLREATDPSRTLH